MNFKFSENLRTYYLDDPSSLAIAKSSSDDSTSFPRRFNVEYTLCVCRVVTYTWSFSRSRHSQAFNGVYGIAVLQILQISQGKRKIFCFLHQISSSDYFFRSNRSHMLKYLCWGFFLNNIARPATWTKWLLHRCSLPPTTPSNYCLNQNN